MLLTAIISSQEKPKVAITIDDPNVNETPLMSWQERNNSILETLKKHNLQAALFVCGKRVLSDSGKTLLQQWNDAGHLICNHSFSHNYYHANAITLQHTIEDFLQCDSIINGYSMYTKLYRYPFLKEGNTLEKRDGFRKFLDEHNYKIGYVSIDASDWYIDGRLIDSLKQNPLLDYTRYKEFYLHHILDRAQYYNNLALEVTGRQITHTLLLHHSLLNALFLDDLIQMFEQNGWEVVNASYAFKDPVFSERPDILPAGESIIWALAKQTGKYDAVLRYPGEDGEYEEAAFNEWMKSIKN
jgi:peptidoglycan/xylan/chitin deacetylase (PgdA/CDA1 family)